MDTRRKSIIPSSGKPLDLDLSLIKTPEDADSVIWWLTDVANDMNRQIADAPNPDAQWLKKVKSARWWVLHLRHKAREAREVLNPEIVARQAVAMAIMDFLDDDEIEELEDIIAERYPHLTGVVLSDIFD